jgi:HEAT repeat protein
VHFAAIDPVLKFALLAALALATISALVMLQVLLLSQLGARRERKRERFEARWRPWLVAESLGLPAADGALAAPAVRRECDWLLRLWNQLQLHLRGSAHARLNALLCAMGMDRHALALLSRRDMRDQLTALATLRNLGDTAYWGAIKPLLEAPGAVLSLAAAEALAAIDPARAMRQILPLAMRRRDWSRNRIDLACRNAGRDAVTQPLVDLLREPLPPWARARLLELLRHAEPRALAPWARGILDRPLPAETAPGAGADADARPGLERIAALRVLAALHDPADRGRILAGLRDPLPEARLAAIDALRAQVLASDADALLHMLSDRTWAVRQAAADALAALPGLDAAALSAMADAVYDRYGREALQRALAERSS